MSSLLFRVIYSDETGCWLVETSVSFCEFYDNWAQDYLWSNNEIIYTMIKSILSFNYEYIYSCTKFFNLIIKIASYNFEANCNYKNFNPQFYFRFNAENMESNVRSYLVRVWYFEEHLIIFALSSQGKRLRNNQARDVFAINFGLLSHQLLIKGKRKKPTRRKIA